MSASKAPAPDSRKEFNKRRKLVEERLQADSSESERKFLDAAEVGDKDVLIEVLETENVSVEALNLSGRTALDLAVDGNNMEIVEYLLPKCSHSTVHRALLCAVENDRNVIFEKILEHPMYQEEGTEVVKELQQDTMYENKTFQNKDPEGDIPKDRSSLLREALTLAARECNFSIVRTLVLRGAYIDPPHDYFCLCTLCTTQKASDMMQYTKLRLDTFKALASPAYISITEKDPIVGSFQLSYKFRKLSDIEIEYKQTYLDLDEQCQQFAIDLVDQCRTSMEVSKVLSGKVTGGHGVDEDSDGEDDMLPVLKLAMRLEQKRFVAHPGCQAQVAQLWFSGQPALRYLNRFGYLACAIPVGMVVIPLMSLVYLMLPFSKVGELLNTPIMRFVSYTCSYISFLVFVMVAKLNYGMSMNEIGCNIISPVQQGLFGFLLVWLFSLMWQESKQIFEAGGKEYISSFWNILDTIMLSLYMCTFSLELIGPRVLQNMYIREYATTGEPDYCAKLRENSFTCENIYKDRQPLIVWEPSWLPDPSLLSDITFSIAVLMSISRFSFIMPSNEQFGTMLVSFGRTMGDIVKLLSMFILVLVAFSCGMTVLYGAEACNNSEFAGLIETMRTLTWAMFGMGDSASTDIEAEPNPSFPLRPDIIANIGSILFMIFVFATAVVLMNLLIAMMANTFQDIQDEREVEWKFGRTELWLNFIEPGSAVPPPFNIIPSTKSILGFCSTLNNFFSPPPNEIGLIQRAETEKVRRGVLSRLVRRYVRKEERDRLEEDEGNSDDLLKRTLERVTTKLEKRLDHLDEEIATLGVDLRNVIDHQNSMTEELQRVV
ncbi:short transient receptor potential channel 3-like [Liolophura sinensis]|uniref:short transient receptor potential channel 3-like n=1 Tax=Liolophura sinensis TaxID=3198878 RepID=UPI00315921ED